MHDAWVGRRRTRNQEARRRTRLGKQGPQKSGARPPPSWQDWGLHGIPVRWCRPSHSDRGRVGAGDRGQNAGNSAGQIQTNGGQAETRTLRRRTSRSADGLPERGTLVPDGLGGVPDPGQRRSSRDQRGRLAAGGHDAPTRPDVRALRAWWRTPGVQYPSLVVTAECVSGAEYTLRRGTPRNLRRTTALSGAAAASSRTAPVPPR